jgi:hypothetical protein
MLSEHSSCLAGSFLIKQTRSGLQGSRISGRRQVTGTYTNFAAGVSSMLRAAGRSSMCRAISAASFQDGDVIHIPKRGVDHVDLKAYRDECGRRVRRQQNVDLAGGLLNGGKSFLGAAFCIAARARSVCWIAAIASGSRLFSASC